MVRLEKVARERIRESASADLNKSFEIEI